MTNEKMEQRLAAALEKTAPDDMSGVLSRCEARKGTVIPMTTKKTANRKWTCTFTKGKIGGWMIGASALTATHISIDSGNRRIAVYWMV